MPYDKVTIPLVKGLDQSIDERINPPDRLAKVTNGYFSKTGAVKKRHGFTKVTINEASGGTLDSARALFSTGSELCIVADNALLSYNEEWDQWVDKGPVSPLSGKQRRFFSDLVEYDQADAAEKDDWVMYVARRWWAFDEPIGVATNQQGELVFHIRSVGDHDAVPAAYTGTISTAVSASKPHAVRAASCTGKLLGLTAIGLASPMSLRVYEWGTASPSLNGPTLAQTVTADLWYANENIRTFDCIELASGDYVVAYIDSTNKNINLERFNASHVSQATDTITAGVELGKFKRVAICEKPSTLTLCVLVSKDSLSGDIVEVWARNSSTLAAQWGPTTLESMGSSILAENLGCAFGATGGNGVFQCVWNEQTSPTFTRMMHDTVDANTGTSVNLAGRYNLMSKSRPFFYDGRFYVVADTTCASHIYASPMGGYQTVLSPAIDCAGIYELRDGGEVSDQVLAGLHDIGSAPYGAAGRVVRQGSANNVFTPSTGKWRYMYTSSAYSLLDASSGLITRHDASEIELDFGAKPIVAVLPSGEAVIGGGFVCWYSGSNTEEMGHAVMPVPYVLTPYNDASGSLVDGTTYTWQAMWARYDPRGVLHRSLPSFQVSVQINTPNDAITLTAKQNPATLRMGKHHSGVLWFREDGAIMKQATEAWRYTDSPAPNIATTEFDEVSVSNLGPWLYTVGGEIEAVCPEGARLPVVAGGRLWLGDFFRRDRVQYSKPFAPGTGTETAIAPEFNEGFGYILENGQSVEAMGALDDKLIVFTADAIFTIAGQGPADDGSGNDFSGLVLVSADGGCIEARSVAPYPDGMFFQSKGGIYQLTRGLQVQNVGKVVEDELAIYPTITSAVLVAAENQVRFTCRNDSDAGIVLVYDYRIREWAKWDLWNASGTKIAAESACMHDGDYYIVQANGQVWKYDETTWLDDRDTMQRWVPLTIETGWLQAAGQSGWQRVRKALPLLGFGEDCTITVSAFQDFDDTTATQTASWTASDIREAGSDRVLPMLHVKRQKCSAFKLQVTDAAIEGAPVNGRGCDMAGVRLEFMLRRGSHKANDAQRS